MTRRTKGQAVTKNADEPLEPLLTINEVAQLLKVSRPTIYELIRNEGLPHIKLTKSVRFFPSSLRVWLVARECIR